MDPTVAALRRYPVKSMGGESLDSVVLDRRGLAGDRWYAVVDDDGRLASGKDTTRFRRRDAVFDHAATTTDAGEVVVSGSAGSWGVGDAELDEVLTGEMGTRVRVRAEADVQHHDAGAVSLVGTATLDRCAEAYGIDADPRRLRVNVLVATDEAFVEETWVGRTIVVGGAELVVTRRVTRCRTIDLAQDGVRAAGPWLRPLGWERDTCMAVYADVVAPGRVAVGDEVVVR